LRERPGKFTEFGAMRVPGSAPAQLSAGNASGCGDRPVAGTASSEPLLMGAKAMVAFWLMAAKTVGRFRAFLPFNLKPILRRRHTALREPDFCSVLGWVLAGRRRAPPRFRAPDPSRLLRAPARFPVRLGIPLSTPESTPANLLLRPSPETLQLSAPA
jgi:hypothetical protein